MAKERQETGGLTEDGLLAAVADVLMRRWKEEKVHKGVSDSESGLSSRGWADLIVAEKDGVLSEGEFNWMKGLREELRAEASRIIDELLRKNPHIRRPLEMQRGEWIEKILLKFNSLIVS